MTLTLRAVSLNDLPLTQPITAHFDRQGGTIGRADHNTMALPDPGRHISRQHAQISAGRRGYVIKNIGSANPIIVRNQPLAQGQSATLVHSDQVRIGGYLLEVIDDAFIAGEATTITSGGAALEADIAPPGPPQHPPTPAAPAGLGDLDGPLSRSNPFGDLLGEGSAPAARPIAAPARREQAPVAARLPDDFDPFAAQPATLPTEAAPDRMPDMPAAFKPQPVAPRPPAEPVAMPVAPDASAASPAVNAGDAAALWRAFCEGAGVRLDAAQAANPELLRIVGMLLRAAVEGTVKLIAVRSATRHELHAQVTVIRQRDNNPLKFSPDAQSALEQLLQPPLRGFLPGPAAMTDAMNDLVGHAIGSMAGTRAALEGVLERFAPQQLEAKLVGKTVLDSLLPMNRKAKLWELYLQHHEDIRDEAQDDFHALFGKAFLAAYEQQLERLRRDKTATPE